MQGRLTLPRDRRFLLVGSFALGTALGALLVASGSRIRATVNHAVAILKRNFAARAVSAASEEETDDVPENAPDHCPGIMSETAGQSDACAGCPNKSICASGELKSTNTSIAEVLKNLSEVKHKLLILSGKGGVGKSTLTSQLAWAFRARNLRVGVLDIDVCGPSIPRMMGCPQDCIVHQSGDGWSPVYVPDCATDDFGDEDDDKPPVAVMSIGFMLPYADDAIIWRGPKKNGLIKQFLTDVLWGSLDILLVDTPPGTSDEHLSIITYLSEAVIDGAVVVTTPQEISLQDVRKEITFCQKVALPVLGVVENMTDSIFSTAGVGDAKGTCAKMGVPYAGAVTLSPELLRACEAGKPVKLFSPGCKTANQIDALVESLMKKINLTESAATVR